ncbi:MAG: thermonuclease family protein [Nitrospirae bacterium]|nr:thermonuclease family protein [Nitrospirota bacterium]
MGSRLRRRCAFALAFLLFTATTHASDRIPVKVVSVVDGDTLVCLVDGKKEKVRLIGIDCPESTPNDKHAEDANHDCCHTPDELIALGKQAKEFTARFLDGKDVALELDAQERDKYGRILAYVWVDSEMLNSALLRAGLAKIMTIPPNVKRANYFYKLQHEAQDAKLGVWE